MHHDWFTGHLALPKPKTNIKNVWVLQNLLLREAVNEKIRLLHEVSGLTGLANALEAKRNEALNVLN